MFTGKPAKFAFLMKYKGILTSALLIIVTALSFTGGTGCANIIPPQGGLKDSLPPVLIKAEPGDSSRNFNGNKITFTFDEFVEVQNIGENLMVSPTPSSFPSIDSRLKTVTIKLKDSLEENTTYIINFGNAIKDFTEGNPLKNFTYTFSTGNYIDSLELRGNVVLAETGKIDTTLIVMLHTNPDDSAVIKEKPRYIVKLDGEGNFHFKNLPPKTFYLYALKDETNTRRYQKDDQLFAFADNAIKIQSNNTPITLYAFSRIEKSVQANIPSAGGLNPAGGRLKNQGNLADKRLKYQTNLIGGQQDLLNDFYFSFEQPLRSFDSTGLKLYTDSTFAAVADYKFTLDSSNRKILLSLKPTATKTNWKENTLYHIILNKEFAEDSTGKKLLKTDTLSFTTRKLSEYGSVRLKLRNLNLTKNPVLQFVLNDAIYKSFPLSSADFSQELFLPGDYDLRILYDDNKNGVWDPGQFFKKHIQPEIVKPIERKIAVKAAWQNEFEIIL